MFTDRSAPYHFTKAARLYGKELLGTKVTGANTNREKTQPAKKSWPYQM